jgi:hypothetical protein
MSLMYAFQAFGEIPARNRTAMTIAVQDMIAQEDAGFDFDYENI